MEMIADCVKDYIEEACRSLHDPMAEEEKVWARFYISGAPFINTLRPRQNGRHFPDDIFKWIFVNENV